MPNYTYFCEPCQHSFNLMRSMSRSAEPAPCPQCGEQAERTLTAPAGIRVHMGTPVHHKTGSKRNG